MDFQFGVVSRAAERKTGDLNWVEDISLSVLLWTII